MPALAERQPDLAPPLVADGNHLALIDPPQRPDLARHSHDLADYEWVPVLRKPRPDGWSPARQRAFIEALADSGSVTQAAREVGMSVSSCYRLRRSPEAKGVAAAWDAALGEASKRLVDIAFDRAVNGVEVPIIDRDGYRIGARTQHSDRLLMFLLRAHHPERYRYARHDTRVAEEPPAPPAAAPVAQAIAALGPATPSDPHLLMPPERLEDALLVADILDGALPLRCRDPMDRPTMPDAPFGQLFEETLELAKQVGRDHSPETPRGPPPAAARPRARHHSRRDLS